MISAYLGASRAPCSAWPPVRAGSCAGQACGAAPCSRACAQRGGRIGGRPVKTTSSEPVRKIGSARAERGGWGGARLAAAWVRAVVIARREDGLLRVVRAVLQLGKRELRGAVHLGEHARASRRSFCWNDRACTPHVEHERKLVSPQIFQNSSRDDVRARRSDVTHLCMSHDRLGTCSAIAFPWKSTRTGAWAQSPRCIAEMHCRDKIAEIAPLGSSPTRAAPT